MKSFILSSLLFMGSLNAQAPQQVQQVPPVAPPPPANNPAALNPANPQAPVNPVPPVQQVTPQQPPATSQYAPPATQPQPGYNPYNPYNPYQQPGFGGGFMGQVQMDPQNLKCEFGQCMNRKITLSPGQGFNLYCEQPMQCNGLDLTLNVGHDPTNWGSGVSEISDLRFDAPTTNAKITINSVGGNTVEVNNIRCSVPGACNGLTIRAGWGVETHNINFHCEVPGACNRCTFNGQDCNMISMMSGNNNGMMAYGYGYTNTANPPPQYGAPQQQPQGPPVYPGVQQPQQPQLPTYPVPPAMPQLGAPQYPYYI